MTKIKRNLFSVLLLFVLLAVCPIRASAAGPISPDHNCTLRIYYKDAITPVRNAHFGIYKVADVNEYAEMTLTSAFEPYKATVSGLSDLGNIKNKSVWMEMASTLKGYVSRDALSPDGQGETDVNGELVLSELKPGLYLVIGDFTKRSRLYSYTAVPFMVFLPGLDSERNEWQYDVTVVPKYSREYYPADDPKDISVKVIKVWDDEGFETIRPAEVTVQLLHNGAVYDTKVLNKGNGWSHTWNKLERGCEWTVVEITPEGYAVSITKDGTTTTIRNKYVGPAKRNEITVLKRFSRQTPPSADPFTFVLTAADASCPMPAGSSGLTKEITIHGAGTVGFGDFDFAKAGTYVYTVTERNDGIKGYTYDPAVYTVTYTVTENAGFLKTERSITSNYAGAADSIIFTNGYGNILPQTGVLWWPVPLLLFAGIAFLLTGMIRRRRCEG